MPSKRLMRQKLRLSRKTKSYRKQRIEKLLKRMAMMEKNLKMLTLVMKKVETKMLVEMKKYKRQELQMEQ